jgi:Uma2 family endonuclease
MEATMSAITEYRKEDLETIEDYLAFHRTRLPGERWQLIDGTAVLMERPTIRHQIIRSNFALELDKACEKTRPNLMAPPGVSLSFDRHPNFLPIVDVAIVEQPADDRIFTSCFFLATEVLSHVSTEEYIDLKVQRYIEQEHNLYTIVIAQTEIRAELWTRSNGWRGVVLRGADEVLELPEFGFRRPLGDLYRRTTVLPT